MTRDMIAVLNLGSRENERLLKEIQSLGVDSALYPHSITAGELDKLPNLKGIIVNGGPDHTVDGVEMEVAQEVYNYKVPVLLADHMGDIPWPEDEAERMNALRAFVLAICGANSQE